MGIIGYSERGIINSLIYSMGYKKELVTKFINLANFPNKLEIKKPDEYQILIEQSLSDFGDADLIIIFNYKAMREKKVFFFEAKVKTVQRKSWSLEKQFNNYYAATADNYPTSNLFFQFYLKNLMMNEFLNIRDGVEDKFKIKRKIGTNVVVLKAIEMLQNCSDIYYIAIVPSPNDELIKFNHNPGYKVNYLSWSTIQKFANINELKQAIQVFEFNEGQIF